MNQKHINRDQISLLMAPNPTKDFRTLLMILNPMNPGSLFLQTKSTS